MACSVSYVLYEPGNFVIGQAVKCIHWLLLDLYIQNDKQLYDIHDVCVVVCVCVVPWVHIPAVKCLSQCDVILRVIRTWCWLVSVNCN